MQKAIINKKEILINEKDFKQILRRFNTKNYKPEDYDNSINISCPLCKKYWEDGCILCPFYILRSRIDGSLVPCVKLIYKIIKSYPNNNYTDITTDYVLYQGRKGKDQIDRIRKFLLTKFRRKLE